MPGDRARQERMPPCFLHSPSPRCHSWAPKAMSDAIPAQNRGCCGLWPSRRKALSYKIILPTFGTLAPGGGLSPVGQVRPFSPFRYPAAQSFKPASDFIPGCAVPMSSPQCLSSGLAFGYPPFLKCSLTACTQIPVSASVRLAG